MTFYFLILFGVYFVLLVALRIGLSRALRRNNEVHETKDHFISVVVPVRDEEKNIDALLASLANQNYESPKWEVIIVDDHSSDNSLQHAAKAASPIKNLAIESLGNSELGKKAALTRGINIAKGDIIATTDADSLLPTDWLTTIAFAFQDTQTKMAVGLVSIAGGSKFFSHWQAMEFASVVGTGMATFGWKSPTMCNGANLAFRREVFQGVNGYQGNEHIASGDDEFLMRKIVDRFPNSIHVMNSIVVTQPQPSIRDFLHQRLRWASKWKGNPSISAKLLAVFIWLCEASWIFFLLSFLRFGPAISVTIALVKVVSDLLFLLPVFSLLKIKFRLLPFLGLQFLYPFYVIFVGLTAPWARYRWKER